MRTASATDADVRAALDSARIVRTHILRPTWHFVAAEDLRWILRLTSAKVESAMGARHRQLGLDAATVDRAFVELSTVLAGRSFMVRSEIGAAFGDAGLPRAGEQVGHLLLRAELTGLICSGPLRGGEHTYALVDEWVPPTPTLNRADAVRQLVGRFFAGHGPAAITDLTRWTTLTQAEIRSALAELADRLATTTVDGMTQWFDPERVDRAQRRPRAFLLPVFDEVFLTYPVLNFPRSTDHPRGDAPHSFAESGGGVIVCDGHDVGWWKRRTRRNSDDVTVVVALPATADGKQRDAVHSATRRLAAFTGHRLVLQPS